ncbi:MAG: WG repeat-containing protein [Phycisphaeraceae bacterium]|nr:WG repeat-containing protein [Phycisphaeraceae bacterium]
MSRVHRKAFLGLALVSAAASSILVRECRSERLPMVPVYWRASDLVPPGDLSPDDLFQVNVNGLTGYIDRTGSMRITPRFEHASPFSEGLAWASRDGLYGYIDTKGEWVIQPSYTLAQHFSHGLAPVRNAGGLHGYIRPDGSWAIEPQFESARSFNTDGRALVGKISLKGRFLSILDAESASDWTYWWIDTSGRKVATCLDPYNPSIEPDGLGLKWEGGGVGYVDHTGQFVIQPVFAEAGQFSEGVAPVRAVGGKWGCIDAAGNWVIEPKWDWAYGFKNGLCEVTFVGANGYVNRHGEVVWAHPTWITAE